MNTQFTNVSDSFSSVEVDDEYTDLDYIISNDDLIEERIDRVDDLMTGKKVEKAISF